MFRIAHFAGRASEKQNLRQCGQCSISGEQHGRCHAGADGKRVSEIVGAIDEGGGGGS
jgi:hypothetical protein